MDKCSDKAEMVEKALDIPKILKIIFKHLDTERLKLCRRVCLKWCNEVSRMFLTRVVPRYAHPAPWHSFHELLNTGKGLTRILCPFQEIYAAVSIENVYSYPFDWLNPLFPITRLSLTFKAEEATHDPELSKHSFLLLQSCSQTLTHLRTFLSEDFWSLTPEAEQDLGFNFAQLKAIQAKTQFRSVLEPKIPFTRELKFFLLVISSAPMLSELDLNCITCAPQLLRQGDFKNIEKLTIRCPDQPGMWRALCYFNSDKLKYVYISGAPGWPQPAPENFYSRFPSTLEHVRKLDGPWELFGLPNVRRLDINAQERLDFSSFPSLREVRIFNSALIPSSAFRFSLGFINSPPSRTVTAVHIDDLCFPPLMLSRRRRVLAQLLQYFPCATYWRINYQSLPDFCQAVENVQFPVQKLGVVLRCFSEHSCLRSKGGMEAAERDLEMFSSLHRLKELQELELHQRGNNSHSSFCRGGEANTNMPVPFNVSTILFSELPQLRILRIFSGAAELPNDMEALQHLDIATELIVAAGTSVPNWSDSFLPMKNVTIHTEQTEFT